MELLGILSEIGKTAIKLDFLTKDNNSSVGTSKFGGKPDVPPYFKWFYFEGEDHEGKRCKRLLSFLAQINCAEIKEYDKDKLLPTKGILYFFYELSSMTWGFDPEDRGSAQVYYFDGDLSEISRMDFPNDMLDDCKLPEIRISFSTKYDLPCFEEFTELYDCDDWDEYDEKLTQKGFEFEETISKFLGYADLIQGGMLLECEKVTNGIYCGSSSEIEPLKQKQLQENCGQWQLLFQLDSVIKDGFELMFGDCGRIYYYIKKDDLRNCRFDDCWLILQCC